MGVEGVKENEKRDGVAMESQREGFEGLTGGEEEEEGKRGGGEGEMLGLGGAQIEEWRLHPLPRGPGKRERAVVYQQQDLTDRVSHTACSIHQFMKNSNGEDARQRLPGLPSFKINTTSRCCLLLRR